MDNIFSQEEQDQLRGKYLKGADFDGDGMQLYAVGKKIIKAQNPRFGAQQDGRGLKKGEVWQYTFRTKSGMEVILESSSVRLAMALARINPSAVDLLTIKRAGIGTDTKWSVSKDLETIDVD